MHKTALLALIETSRLAGNIKELFARAVTAKSPSGLKTAIKNNPQAFIQNVDRMLTACGAILGYSKADVLFITGFNKNDMARERFEAALAELRAVLFLNSEGFSSLKLLPQASATGADITGMRGGRNYIFEVRCLRADDAAGPLAYLFSNTRKPQQGAVEYLRRKYDKKIRQVNSSRKRTGNKYGGVIFALNPACFSAGPGAPELKTLAAALHLAKNSPPYTHIGLLAGPVGCIFPDWPAPPTAHLISRSPSA